MRTIKTSFVKRFFVCLVAALAFSAPHFLFLPNQASALGGHLAIIAQEKLYIQKSEFKVVAQVKGSSVYDGGNIAWKLTLRNDPATTAEPQRTELGIDRTESIAYFNIGALKSQISVKAGDEVIITAYIDGTNYFTSHTSLFVDNKSTGLDLSIIGDNDTRSYKKDGNYQAFVFELSDKINPTEWFVKDGVNKYLRIENSSATYSLSEYTLTFLPKQSGTYTFLAKSDGSVSNPVTVYVEFQSLTNFEIRGEQIGKNGLGLNTYLIEIVNPENLDIDTDSINWYRRGYNTPVQYGGTSFLLNPNAYAVYQIYAKYGNTESNYESGEDFIADITVNRTKEIFTIVGVVVGVMGIGLIIIIRRNIKRDRVW